MVKEFDSYDDDDTTVDVTMVPGRDSAKVTAIKKEIKRKMEGISPEKTFICTTTARQQFANKALEKLGFINTGKQRSRNYHPLLIWHSMPFPNNPVREDE